MTGDQLDPECAHGVGIASRGGMHNWCPDCEAAGYVVLAHEHDASCSFGNPQCPAFSEEPPARRPWWKRLMPR